MWWASGDGFEITCESDEVLLFLGTQTGTTSAQLPKAPGQMVITDGLPGLSARPPGEIAIGLVTDDGPLW